MTFIEIAEKKIICPNKSYLIKIEYLCVKLINYFNMNTGRVKFFNDAKGFGFISEEGTGKEHFVHVSGLVDEIRENDEVEFELEQGKKGLNAVNVRVIS
jgi:CspA family cold shock protein